MASGPRLFDVADYGTGSYPEPPHGWHLSMRRTVR